MAGRNCAIEKYYTGSPRKREIMGKFHVKKGHVKITSVEEWTVGMYDVSSNLINSDK